MTFRKPNAPGWWKVTTRNGLHFRYVLLEEKMFLNGKPAGLVAYLVGCQRPFELSDPKFAGCTWEKAS